MKFLTRNGNGVEQNGDGRSKPLLDPNPYFAARRQWNSQIDRAFAAQHVWQLIGISGLLIGLAGVAGNIWTGSQSKFVPYVIEVDKLGEAVAVGPAQQAAPADTRVVRASLASFISSARLVSPDQDVQRQSIFRVYSMLRQHDPATTKMNEYLGDGSENSPFKRSRNVMVSTEKFTVLPISSTAWQADWEEVTRDRDGALIGRANWRCTLQMYIEPPGDTALQADIQKNPLGIFVRDYTWMQR